MNLLITEAAATQVSSFHQSNYSFDIQTRSWKATIKELAMTKAAALRKQNNGLTLWFALSAAISFLFAHQVCAIISTRREIGGLAKRDIVETVHHMCQHSRAIKDCKRITVAASPSESKILFPDTKPKPPFCDRSKEVEKLLICVCEGKVQILRTRSATTQTCVIDMNFAEPVETWRRLHTSKHLKGQNTTANQ